jgi:hypothetical protein
VVRGSWSVLSTKLLEITKNSHTHEQQHIKAQHSTTTMSDKVSKPKLEQLHINLFLFLASHH